MNQLPLLGPGDNADEDSTTDRPDDDHVHLDRNAHNSGNPLSCVWMTNGEQCHHTCNTETDLSEHYRAHCNESRDRICYWRGCTSEVKKFSKRQNLRNHVRLGHLNERKYPCDVCKKRFQTPSDLKRHMMIHGKVCNVCNGQLQNGRCLTSHMRSPSPKKCSCGICGQTFTRAANMKRHLNDQHPGQKPSAGNQETSTEHKEHMKTENSTGGQHCDESVSEQVSVTEAHQDPRDHTIGADNSQVEHTTTTDDESTGQEDNSNQMNSNNGNNHGQIVSIDYNQDRNLYLYPKESQEGKEYRDLSKL